MKPYEKYTNTNISWIKTIPTHWNLERIGSLFTERKEKVSDKEYSPLSVTKNGVLPQLTTAAKSDDGDNRKKVVVGDFVVNSRSDRKGSSGISPLTGSVSLINIVLEPRMANNTRYIHYLLRNHLFIEEYYRNGRGIVADLWTTRYSEMKTIMLPVPPRSEQDQIVRFLDWKLSKINKLIRAKKKQIALLNEQKQAIIDKAVTNGLDDTAPMKDSGIPWIGRIPSSWHIVSLKRCTTIQTGITLGKQYLPGTQLVERPYLRVANVQNGYIDISNVTTIKVTYDEDRRYRLKSGQVLMTEGGDRDKLGRGCVWKGQLPLCLHQNHIFALSVNEALLNNYFLEYLTISNVGREYFDVTATKTTNLACTNSSKVMAFLIPLPSIAVQKDIVSYLKNATARINSLITKLGASIDCFLEYKANLISSVVTGQVDVREIVVPDFELENEPLDEVSDEDREETEETEGE
ncbi:restriction endonuclease subunit S [uncultured Oscillibacter sp.]|uniref:restriction endonuclease subunit S n=1 Tax=uncultured Oscillibacter sp. TaxID=876091 RepID=UPI0028056D19|nr:restriction endonuclease subunit S [uncultured Oscillibacter sp.]